MFTFHEGCFVALGAEHSSLNRQVEDVARHMGLEVSPDPMPEQNFFVRSDQYSFVKQGIPAVAIGEGFKTVDSSLDGKKIQIAWMATYYHKPQDDMNQPLNFNAARKCTQVILAVGSRSLKQRTARFGIPTTLSASVLPVISRCGRD